VIPEPKRFRRTSALVLPVLLAVQSACSSAPPSAAPPAPGGAAEALPLKHDPQPTTAEITTADLMTRLYVFSDDSLRGREAGTEGNFRGTEYIAREAQKIGLQPAGENGTYFQTIPLRTRSLGSASRFSTGGVALRPGTEFGGALCNRDIPEVTAPLVYGGTLGDPSAISGAAANGKVMVYRYDPGVSQGVQPPAGAVANAAVFPDQLVAYLAAPRTSMEEEADNGAEHRCLYLSEEGAAKLFGRPVEQLKPGATAGNATFALRWNVGPSAAPARNVVAVLPGSDPALRGEYVAIGAHNDHVGVADQPVDHDSLRIFNHIVRPGGAEDEGTMATAQQQAEVDRRLAAWRAAHPGGSRMDSVFNGADDDGSGTVSVLEIAQKLAASNPHPRRSILFVWHTAEELGLFGSEYFTDHPTVPRDSIVAQLNIDMVGRGAASDVTGLDKAGNPLHGGPDYLQLVGSRRLSTELGDLAESVNRSGNHGLHFDYSMDANGHPMNIYCRSDHYEYARYGIPIIFFTTGGHSDYHQLTDEPEYIDYPHMVGVDRYIADLLVHVADLDHRPVVDHPKPDPNAPCRQ
jgi:hypothetical protein